VEDLISPTPAKDFYFSPQNPDHMRGPPRRLSGGGGGGDQNKSAGGVLEIFLG